MKHFCFIKNQFLFDFAINSVTIGFVSNSEMSPEALFHNLYCMQLIKPYWNALKIFSLRVTCIIGTYRYIRMNQTPSCNWACHDVNWQRNVSDNTRTSRFYKTFKRFIYVTLISWDDFTQKNRCNLTSITDVKMWHWITIFAIIEIKMYCC